MAGGSPLHWPAGWPRTPAHDRERAKFHRKTSQGLGWGSRRISIGEAANFLVDELIRLGIAKLPDGEYDYILSTDLKLRLDGLPYSNQKSPDDPGVAAWWTPWGEDGQRVIAIDRYDRIADNIYAIGKTIEAMRGIDRWGGGEILTRTFAGFTALPSPESIKAESDPWSIIGVSQGANIDDVKRAYRIALSAAHPDKGGNSAYFQAVKDAGRTLGVA